MRLNHSSSVPTAQINITPYIDILLVLLIIFMVIQPVTEFDLETRVPQESSEGAIQEPLPAIVLTLDSEFHLTINNETVTWNTLGERLFEIYSARRDKNLFVQGASELPFGAVAGIIDIAKGAGVGDIGLMTAW